MSLTVGASSPSALRFIHRFEMSVLLIGQFEQVAEVLHAVMRLLLGASNDAHVGALAAPVNNCGTLVLM